MTTYHIAGIKRDGLFSGETGYAFPTLEAASIFAVANLRSPSAIGATVVDDAGVVVVEFLPDEKDTYTWVADSVKGFRLTIS